MKKTWVVVINGSAMKIFLRRTDHTLTHLRTIPNRLIRYENSELGRHRPGMVVEGGHHGSAHHAMTTGQTPRQLVVQTFARKMAKILDEARKKGSVNEFMIIAEPKLLGLIKKSFSRIDKQMTTRWIVKDLKNPDTKTLESLTA